MNTDTLKIFITVAQAGSISSAAQQLGYAQSNISTKVQQLEAALNTQLFHRTNRGIHLTATGQQLFDQAIQIVQLTEKAIADIQHPHEVRGQLRIGTLQTAASTFLPPILSAYHQHYADVNLTIQTGTTLANAQRVANYQLDGAIIGGQVSDHALTCLPLMQESLCLITANSTNTDITQQPMLVFPVGCAYRQTLTRWRDAQQLPIPQPIEFDYLNAIIASVSAGLGISILPQRVVQPYLDAGAIRAETLPDAFSTLPISFIYRTDAVMAPPLECFIKQIKSF
ncbi:LysR family transcriptional regulator [Lactiplantibacillus pentosus]|uniref:LysR family transcriptional regulator n=1 Tax=Lactiplantibacillus pentosus TaxID=1589 RepID=UPI001C1FC9FE|nr:LysR family transcriptional regulator [Lactiplantibacillus pentosus]MBU7503200.1 LysR family transcriptional regulator [Lactiplantibacillus pentosus]MDY1546239.1 LysR family transcriptional regulator [Lactiplantibacillus pentosus]